MSIKNELFILIPKEEREWFLKYFKNSTEYNKYFIEALEKEIEKTILDNIKDKNYCGDWAYKQAHNMGKIEALNKLKNLFSESK